MKQNWTIDKIKGFRIIEEKYIIDLAFLDSSCDQYQYYVISILPNVEYVDGVWVPGSFWSFHFHSHPPDRIPPSWLANPHNPAMRPHTMSKGPLTWCMILSDPWCSWLGEARTPPANARFRGTHKKTAKLILNPYYTMPTCYTNFSETLRIVWTGVLIYLWYASLDHLPKVFIKWSWTPCPAAVVTAPIQKLLPENCPLHPHAAWSMIGLSWIKLDVLVDCHTISV